MIYTDSQWYTLEDYGTNYDIIINSIKNDNIQKYSINEANESKHRYGDYSQVSLPQVISIDHVKLVIHKAKGQSRLLIGEIGIF